MARTSLRARLSTWIAAGGLLAGGAAAGAPSAAARIAADVAWLAAPEREGRGAGEPGLAAAGALLEARLAELGLAPAGDAGTFRQELTLTVAPTCGTAPAPPGARALFNVLGRVDPAAPPPDEGVVLVGAHYDHLGCAALPGGGRAIFPGAEDNASGVAALLETARLLAASRARLARPVVVVFFTAEEQAQAGSNRLARHPPPGLARQRLRVLVNLDSVGRLAGGELTVAGRARSEGWAGELERAGARTGVAFGELADGSPISDHVPFLLAGIPAILLTTGTPAEHHTPGDLPARVDAAGAARVAAFAAELAIELAARQRPLALHRAPRR